MGAGAVFVGDMLFDEPEFDGCAGKSINFS